MKILLTGSNGLLGSALQPLLTGAGHEVIRLVREKTNVPGAIVWNPAKQELDPTHFDGFDAAIHLAGESIGDARWTPAVKERILHSRTVGTKFLAEELAKLPKKPRVLICASAIGYYGHRGDEILTESSQAGTGFLAEVCKAWEAAAQPARDAGIRVVHLRFGMILARQGGALSKMLLPFKLGLGGIVGDGKQYWSWITLADAAGALQFALEKSELVGPINAVAPHPVTNREFTKTLGKVIARPTIFPMPAFAARLALGEMANELLLSSARVYPKTLEAAGYAFQHTSLDHALQAVLAK